MTADVLIVGAGPSGSTLARLLARRGWRVSIVDRQAFPRPKPCGEFLNPGALRALARTGASAQDVRGMGATIRGWELTLARSRHRARFGPEEVGASVPRSLLDEHLVHLAAEAGADVRLGWRYQRRIGDSERGGSGAFGLRRLASGETQVVRARVLVGAGGLRCPVAAELGAARRKPRIRKVSLTCRGAGLLLPSDLGILRVAGDLTVGALPSDAAGASWNLTVVVPSDRFGRVIARDSAGFFRDVLRQTGPWPGLEIVDGPWASGPFDRPTRFAFRETSVLVGDAAGYFDPFTGQGLGQAVRSAELLAPRVHRVLTGMGTPPREFLRYGRVLARERRPTYRNQRLVDAFLRGSARQRSTSRILSRWEPLYAGILRVTGDVQPLHRMLRLPGSGRPIAVTGRSGAHPSWAGGSVS